MVKIQPLKRLFSPEGLPALIILLGLALRIYCAFVTIDQFHPDEHFQTLEPASKAVFGFGWLSWEWTMGLRSWFVPALYMPVLFLLKIVGIKGGPVTIYACRLYQAYLSGLLLWGFHVLLKRAGFRFWNRMLALGVLALSPVMVCWGPATLSDNLALIYLWATMPYFLTSFLGDKPRGWFVSGLVLGVTFLIRIQMGLWAAGVGLVALVMLPREKGWPAVVRTLALFSAGYVCVILFQGVLDWATWGKPFHSVLTNIDMNFFKNAGATYGVAPWYDYFSMLTRNPGNLWLVSFLLLLIANLTTGALQARVGDLMLIVPAAVFLAGHMIIPHKEIRFLLPIFPSILFANALMLENLCDRFLDLEDKVVTRLSRGFGKMGTGLVGMLVLPLGLWGVGVQVGTPPNYSWSNMSELMLWIQKDGALARHPSSCLLFVDHYWVWSHGELLQGHPVRWIETHANQLEEQNLKECDYAVTVGASDAVFRMKTQGSWHHVKSSVWGYSLFKRDGAG